MKALQNFFDTFGELSSDEKFYLANQFEQTHVKKGTPLFEEGEVVDRIYFIGEGILHHFNYNDDGERKTLDLHDGPCFCTDLHSFSEGKRSEESCVALSDSTLYVLTKTKYNALINSNIKWSNFVKGIIERTLIKMLDQVKNTANKSLEERYLELVRTKPKIIQNVSLRVIASYLGTSRETLHRIRRRHLVA